MVMDQRPFRKVHDLQICWLPRKRRTGLENNWCGSHRYESSGN